ncbi:hypothetical protein V1478_000277 [Vespula squamosa]|uniref:Uncharacterized protein n=1 Tax=Vespula squamosa TaxID=30214 RepID=A0ABD2C517_VESSQ
MDGKTRRGEEGADESGIAARHAAWRASILLRSKARRNSVMDEMEKMKDYFSSDLLKTEFQGYCLYEIPDKIVESFDKAVFTSGVHFSVTSSSSTSSSKVRDVKFSLELRQPSVSLKALITNRLAKKLALYAKVLQSKLDGRSMTKNFDQEQRKSLSSSLSLYVLEEDRSLGNRFDKGFEIDRTNLEFTIER